MIALLRGVGAALLRLPRGLAWIPVVLWLALITWFSSWPQKDVGQAGWTPIFTNLGHAPLFGLLALWMALALPREAGERGWPRLDAAGRRAVLLAVGAAAILDELHQHLGGRGRELSLLDLGTDLVGAAGLLLVAAYAGRADATGAGLWLRIGLAAGACVGAAAAATWVPGSLPDVWWL